MRRDKWTHSHGLSPLGAALSAELDAADFLLYGIARDDVEYVLSTFSGTSDQAGSLGAFSAAGRILKHYDRLKEEAKQ